MGNDERNESHLAKVLHLPNGPPTNMWLEMFEREGHAEGVQAGRNRKVA